MLCLHPLLPCLHVSFITWRCVYVCGKFPGPSLGCGWQNRQMYWSCVLIRYLEVLSPKTCRYGSDCNWCCNTQISWKYRVNLVVSFFEIEHYSQVHYPGCQRFSKRRAMKRWEEKRERRWENLWLPTTVDWSYDTNRFELGSKSDPASWLE